MTIQSKLAQLIAAGVLASSVAAHAQTAAAPDPNIAPSTVEEESTLPGTAANVPQLAMDPDPDLAHARAGEPPFGNDPLQGCAVRGGWPFVCEELVPVGWRITANLALLSLGTGISRGRTMRCSARVPEIARSSAHRTIALIDRRQACHGNMQGSSRTRRSATAQTRCERARIVNAARLSPSDLEVP